MATYTWTGAANDGSYANPLNWTPNGVPSAADTVSIASAATPIAIGGDAALAANTGSLVSLSVADGSSFTFGAAGAAASFANAGTLTLGAGADATSLVLGGASLMLSGQGSIVMTDSAANTITAAGAGATLTNAGNLIEGAGQIGAGLLAFVNDATVDATGTNALTINTGSLTVTNAGLLEATGAGGLVLDSAVGNGAAGQIAAAGGNVYLDGAALAGGTLASSLGAAIVVQAGQSGALDGTAHAVDLTGTVDDAGTLALLGTITDAGSIVLQGGTLLIGSAAEAGTVTLAGGGIVTAADSANAIAAASAGEILVNQDTIDSAGSIGGGGLAFVNQGTLAATGTLTATTLAAGGTFSNTGLIAVTGAAGLIVAGVSLDNAGGTLSAEGGFVRLGASGAAAGTITGGVLQSNASYGVFIGAQAAGVLAGVTNQGQVVVADGGLLSLSGSTVNAGTIALLGTGTGATLDIGGTVALSGAGTLLLSNSAGNLITGTGAAATLANAGNTIAGAGTIGNGTAGHTVLTLANAGIIDATGSHALVLATGGGLVTNTGLIEAVGKGGLAITNTSVSNAGGTISAIGGNVTLGGNKAGGGGTIQGGLVSSTGSSAIVVQARAVAGLDGLASPLTLAAQVHDGGTLSLLGTIANSGAIAVQGGAALVIASPTVTLTGGGAVTLDGTAGDIIKAAAAHDTLANAGNTIAGGGQIGDGTLSMTNGGTISANATTALSLDFGGAGATLTNSALVSATGTGGLAIIDGTVISNAGGTVLAAGGVVSLGSAQGVASGIAGGLVHSTGSGSFAIASQATGILDGAAGTLTLIGQVADSGTLALRNTILNEGTITVQGGAALQAASPTVTLNGPGLIILADQSGNSFGAAAAGDTVTNVANTIEGTGFVGTGGLNLTNAPHGTIAATGATNAMILSFATGTLTNAGLIEATGAAGLAILNGTMVRNAGGTVAAAGGSVMLGAYQGAASGIAGGTLSSSGGNMFSVGAQSTAVLDGSAGVITDNAALSDSGTLDVLGTLGGHGTLALQTGGATLVADSARVTLTGGGTIALNDAQADIITGAAARDVLVNAGDTITGAGLLGNGMLSLVNSGTIAQAGAGALTLNLSGTGTNTTAGRLLGTGAGGLVAQAGAYTNAGLIEATDASSVTFLAGATLTNLSAAGTLKGGTYTALSTGDTTTLAFAGAALTLDQATLRLVGQAAAISFGGVAIQASLTGIAAGASLIIGGGADYASTLTLHNAGQIDLVGSTLAAAGVTDAATGTLTGTGTLSGQFIGAGAIAPTLTGLDLSGGGSITGTVTGTRLTFDTGTTTLAAAGYNATTLAVINGATLNIAAPLSFGAAFTTFDIAGAASLVGTGTIALGSAVTFEQTGHGTASIASAVSNAGSLLIVSGGGLAFSGGLANTGLITDNGSLTDTAALTGGSLHVGAGTGAASIATAAGAGNSTLATLSLAGGTLDTNATTLTVTGDYTNTATGSGNAYDAQAGVQGTIDGQGTQLAVVGARGTTIGGSGGTLTIAIAAGQTAYFQIENTGAAGAAALRGALQTSAGGASITGAALSGSGVTAGNFGPVLAGGASGIYAITYAGGGLTNESIHLASDFANVAGVTIDIVAAPAPAPSYASGAVSVPAVDWLAGWHAGR